MNHSEQYKREPIGRRQTQGCDSVGDDVPCSKCGAVALDTGLECSECGHDMAPELNSLASQATHQALDGTTKEWCAAHPASAAYIINTLAAKIDAMEATQALTSGDAGAVAALRIIKGNAGNAELVWRTASDALAFQEAGRWTGDPSTQDYASTQSPQVREQAALPAELSDDEIDSWSTVMMKDYGAPYTALRDFARTIIGADRMTRSQGTSQAAATGGAVYVCPEKDIVCGHRPANLCASCPLRKRATPQDKT